MLKNVHARRLVMSVGGITEAGLFNSNSLLVEAERASTSTLSPGSSGSNCIHSACTPH